MDWLNSGMSLLTAVITLVLIAIFVPLIWKYFRLKYRTRNFKGPKGLPFLGNILSFVGHGKSVYLTTMCKFGEEFRENGRFLLYFGLKPMLVLYNAKDVEMVLRNNKIDERGIQATRFMVPWLGHGLFTSKGAKWASRRKLLTPSFHFSILKNFLISFNKHARYLTDKLCEMVEEEGVDIAPLLNLCTLDIVCETIMGLKLGVQKGESKEYGEAIHRLQRIIVERSTKPWCWNNAIFALTDAGKEFERYVKIVHRISKKVIATRKEEIQKLSNEKFITNDVSLEARRHRKLALLDFLIQVQKNDSSFTDDEIQHEVDTFMFGGNDTTSTAIIFTLYLIGRHPKVQRKVQGELRRVFGNDRERSVTSGDLQELEYMSCVIKESHRIFPPVPFIGREIEEDISICGSEVPKGVSVFLAVYILHRDPHYFPNPEKFDPDRFLPANSEGRHNCAFIPFSAGPRNCIGQKFATMEQKVLLATILRKLNITSLQTPEELDLTSEIVLRPRNAINVKLNLRPSVTDEGV